MLPNWNWLVNAREVLVVAKNFDPVERTVGVALRGHPCVEFQTGVSPRRATPTIRSDQNHRTVSVQKQIAAVS